MATRKPTPKAAVASNAAVTHTQQLAKLVSAVRHEKAFIDNDLAQPYVVGTSALNCAVIGNASHFRSTSCFSSVPKNGTT